MVASSSSSSSSSSSADCSPWPLSSPEAIVDPLHPPYPPALPSSALPIELNNSVILPPIPLLGLPASLDQSLVPGTQQPDKKKLLAPVMRGMRRTRFRTPEGFGGIAFYNGTVSAGLVAAAKEALLR
jgi:hypothetical protein